MIELEKILFYFGAERPHSIFENGKNAVTVARVRDSDNLRQNSTRGILPNAL